MSKAIFHVLDNGASCGTYVLTGSWAVKSWADILRACFDANGGKVVPVSMIAYYSSAAGSIAPQLNYSTHDLPKLGAGSFMLRDLEERFADYLDSGLS